MEQKKNRDQNSLIISTNDKNQKQGETVFHEHKKLFDLFWRSIAVWSD